MTQPEALSDAASPRVYATAMLGPNTRRYLIDHGWIDRRTIQPLERPSPLVELITGVVADERRV